MYRYKVDDVWGYSVLDIEQKLNQYGTEGWRIVGITNPREGGDAMGMLVVLEQQDATTAAAPDLLAACEGIRDHCPCDPDINPKWWAAWEAMLDAITHATRETADENSQGVSG